MLSMVNIDTSLCPLPTWCMETQHLAWLQMSVNIFYFTIILFQPSTNALKRKNRNVPTAERIPNTTCNKLEMLYNTN